MKSMIEILGRKRCSWKLIIKLKIVLIAIFFNKRNHTAIIIALNVFDLTDFRAGFDDYLSFELSECSEVHKIMHLNFVSDQKKLLTKSVENHIEHSDSILLVGMILDG